MENIPTKEQIHDRFWDRVKRATKRMEVLEVEEEFNAAVDSWGNDPSSEPRIKEVREYIVDRISDLGR